MYNNVEDNVSITDKDFDFHEISAVDSREYKKEELNNMSVLIMGATNEGIYCVSDSRSSRNGVKETDNWQKIMYCKDLNIIIGLTGTNEKNNTNLLYYIKTKLEVDGGSTEAIQDTVDYIARYTRYLREDKTATQLFFGFFGTEPFSIPKVDFYQITNRDIVRKVYGRGEYVVSGSTYHNKFLSEYASALPYEMNISDMVDKISACTDELIAISNKYLGDKSPVGGDIQSIIINKEGVVKSSNVQF